MSRWQSVETVTIAVLMIAGWASMLVGIKDCMLHALL